MRKKKTYSYELNRDESWVLSYADLVTNLLLFFVTMLGASQMSAVKHQQVVESLNGGRQSATSLKKLETEMTEMIEKIKDDHLENALSVVLKKDGLALSFNSGVMFDLGDAHIKPQWQETLDHIIKHLKPYSERYRIAVEGHTDSVPVRRGSRFSSNWELGSARAAQIRDRLEKFGIPKERMRIESYADTVPLPIVNNKNEQRRRVVIRLF